MVYVLVLEDQLVQRRRLVEILERIDRGFCILETDSIEIGLEISKNYPINLFFIDIELRDGSGLAFAEDIRKNSRYEFTWIIFITSYYEHMLRAFKRIHCYDYIIKPYEDEEIEKLIQKLLRSPQYNMIQEAFVTFEINGVFMRFYIKDIYFIEAMGKHCMIHTVHGQYLIKRMSLRNVLNMDSSSGLIQVHRSYIINPYRIKMVDCRFGSWMIHFEGYDKTAMVGFTFQNKMRKYLSLKEER